MRRKPCAGADVLRRIAAKCRSTPTLDLTSVAISDLPNLGPKSQQMLDRAGIVSLEQLRALGSVRAYARVKRNGGNPTLNLLWALEGALTGTPWQDVAREHRTSLLLALESYEREV
jgi:DNA transformation protein